MRAMCGTVVSKSGTADLPGSSVRVLTLVPDGDLDDLDDDQDHGDRQVAAQGGEPELAASGHDRLGQHVERRHPPGVAGAAVHVDRAVRPAGARPRERARGPRPPGRCPGRPGPTTEAPAATDTSPPPAMMSIICRPVMCGNSTEA